MALRKINDDNYVKEQKKKKAKKIKKESVEMFPKIEYPKEIQLLDELNEANKEKYMKWLYKKKLTEEILGESTLIIGVKGKDGVVLGGDTKAMRGGETDFEKKVKSITTIQKAPIIFASAGAVGVIDDFIEIFEKTLIANIEKGKISSLLSIKIIAEDLVEKAERLKSSASSIRFYPSPFLPLILLLSSLKIPCGHGVDKITQNDSV